MGNEVGIKLSKILSSDYLKQSKILTGKKSIHKVVTKVNVMVDPDILSWVSPGEFVLSTSYFFKHSSLKEQENFIEEMANVGVTALGIKIEPYLDKLPDKIIELAERLEFPIVSIDYSVSFSDIMTPVLSEIFDQQSRIIRKVETIHKDNMEVVLKGGGIKEILRSLSKTMRNPIYVVDHHFEEIIENERVNKEINQKLREKIDSFFNSKKNNKLISKTSRRSIFVDGKEIDQLMVPIMVKNNVYGHLITFGIKHKLQRFDILNLESSSNVMALEFLKRLSVQDVENKYKAEFFEDLISLDEKRVEKAIERASSYGFQKDFYYNVIKCDLIDGENSTHEFLTQAINKSTYLINLICKDKKQPFLISNKGSSIYILIMFKSKKSIEKRLLSLVKDIEGILKSKLNKVEFIFGIGRNYKGLENINRSLDDATKAINSYGSYTEDKIIFFNQLGVYKILCHDDLKEELNEFYKEYLIKLIEYDEKRDTDLIYTLNMYFEENGNLKKMSENMYTHYNTILYRMKRIKEITGIDINNRRERYNLETALEIYKIMNKK